MSSTQQAIALYPNVAREFFYLQGDHYAIACWRHSPINENIRSRAIVLCPPFGHEYTHSHRSFKHLAEYLAAQGFTVFRFDYYSTGDSIGSSFDEKLVPIWIDNICLVAKHAQRECSNITLIGLRLGASLAALAAQEIAASHLVLWEPIIKGKNYIRELTAIARLSGKATSDSTDWIECAGFLITTETQKAISAIDLSTQKIATQGAILLVARDDKPSENAFKNLLSFTHKNISEIYVSGFAEMLDEPHKTKVPFTALQTIAQWLNELPSESNISPAEESDVKNELKSLSFEYDGVLVEEEPCWYEPQTQLFGIISHPKDSVSTKFPAIVLLNSGSVHHIGPNRIYTDIARTLATQGFFVLRMDLEGLGDSASRVPDFENHPYQPNVLANTYSAMNYLRNRGIADLFVLGGICSGAYSAFHTALTDIASASNLVDEIFLINPLTFYWHKGMSLLEPQQDVQVTQDKNYYKKSLRDINKWKRLFSGKTSISGIIRFLAHYILLKLNIFFHDIKEFIVENKSQLTLDFNRLICKKIPVTFIFSEAEPGIEIIKKNAHRMFKRGERKGIFRFVVIEQADHTFSKLAVRKNLLHNIKKIFNHLKQEKKSQ